MRIGEKLKKLRLEACLTQAQLAQALNIGQTTVAAYENGTHDPQVYSLIAYADFFKCSLDYLVGREDELGNINIYHEETITEAEKQLLSAYRLLNPPLKSFLTDNALWLVKSELNKK